MNDLINRADAISVLEIFTQTDTLGHTPKQIVEALPSAQPEGWMERNKERILQAGMEGREIEFHIGGRLFAIREIAQ